SLGPANPFLATTGVIRASSILLPAPGSGQRSNGVAVLHLIDNLIGPEAFQPMKQLVKRREFVGIDATNLLHRARLLQAERLDNLANLPPFLSKLEVNRASINGRALLLQQADLCELLQIVRDVRSEIVAASAQLARA